ncbi:MAG: bifunctional oligoribonuclease/PAP phosphatase NrnA [Planctomycetes bacterium]|nr:bifunctional oligoribonuclease/PAP phosphatase NrnA [Planctomycetota bacterium]
MQNAEWESVNNYKTVISKILGVVKKHRRFLITGHARPDGDCLGSELAIARMLTRMGKSAHVINYGSISRELFFMPGVKQVRFYRKGDRLPDDIEVAFVIDSGGLSRLEELEPAVRRMLAAKSKPFLINIDHHPSNGDFGDINWVNAKSSSVGEMIYLLIKQSGVKMDKDIATNLYVSLDTDTGHFCFETTTPMSHQIAADLIEKGVKVRDIYRKIYEDKTIGEMRLFVECLRQTKLAFNGRIAWSVLTRQMYRKFGATPTDSQNYLSTIRAIEGVKVALLFKETEQNPLSIKVSIRTDRPIDADGLVKALGGGGHHRAAGVTMKPPVQQACRQLIKHIAGLIKS